MARFDNQFRPGRAGLFGLGRFAANRNLFESVRAQQNKSISEREGIAKVSAAAGGGRGKGNVEARLFNAKYIGSEKVAPPTPPGQPQPYQSKWAGVTARIVDYANSGATVRYKTLRGRQAVQFFEAEARNRDSLQGTDYRAYLRGQGLPTTQEYDADYRQGVQTYQQNINRWRGLNQRFGQDSAEAVAYNKDFAQNKAAFEVGKETATAESAASGKSEGGGGFIGTGQEAGQGGRQSSPGLSFIKRPDTIWI